MSLGFLLNSNKKQGTKDKIRPGIYISEIVSIAEAKGYKAGDAYTITYQLSDGDKHFSYRETLINDTEDSRTAFLVNYLAENGIQVSDWSQLVGLREEVHLLKESKGQRGVFLNIVDRRIIK